MQTKKRKKLRTTYSVVAFKHITRVMSLGTAEILGADVGVVTPSQSGVGSGRGSDSIFELCS